MRLCSAAISDYESDIRRTRPWDGGRRAQLDSKCFTMKYETVAVVVLLGLLSGLSAWQWVYHKRHDGSRNSIDNTAGLVDYVTRPVVKHNLTSRPTKRLYLTSLNSTEQQTSTNNDLDLRFNRSTTSPTIVSELTTTPFSETTPLSLNIPETSEYILNTTSSLDFAASEIHLAYENSSKTSSQYTNSTEEDVDYVSIGQLLLSEASKILDNGIWNFQRKTEEGDEIFSRQLEKGNMVYRLTGVVDMPAQNLLAIIYDGLADYSKWNPALLECRVLEKINDNTDISYTVSAPGVRGYVASRDFVCLRHWDLRDNTYVAASKSIDFSSAPSNPDYIRGLNGPGCIELRPLSSDPSKTEFRWLLNTKLNGWIPSYIADKAFKKFMTKYMSFLREYCKKIKQRASDSSTTPKNITDYI